MSAIFRALKDTIVPSITYLLAIIYITLRVAWREIMGDLVHPTFDHLRLPLMRHPATLITTPIPAIIIIVHYIILIILIIHLYTRAQKEYSSTNFIKFHKIAADKTNVHVWVLMRQRYI